MVNRTQSGAGTQLPPELSVKALDDRSQHKDIYRILLERSPQGIVIIHLNPLRLSFVNQATADITGYTAEELKAVRVDRIGSFIHPEDVQTLLDRFAARISGKPLEDPYEFRIFTKEGRLRWVQTYAILITDVGSPAILAFSTDITRRKQTEEALRESEERFRYIFDQAPVGAAIISIEQRFMQTNEEYCRIVGYSDRELASMYQADIIHPEDLDDCKARMADLISGRVDRCQREKRYVRKDGTVVWVNVCVRMLCDSAGRPLYLLSIIDEVTDRKRAEEALRQSEEQYRRLFENLHDLFCSVDLEGKILLASPACRRVTGYTPEEFVGTNVRDYTLNTEEWDRFISLVLEEGATENFEARFRTKDGTVVWGSINACLVFDHRGRVMGVEGTVRDITRSKKAEEAILRNEKQLEAKTRELEEMNTALKILLKRREDDKVDLEETVLSNVRQMVMPYLEKMKNTRLDSTQKMLIDILGSHLSDMVSPFLTRLSSRFLHLTPTEIQVADLIREGRTTKEIAELMNLSDNTIMAHRYHLRNKLGIKNQKLNLKSYLRTMSA